MAFDWEEIAEELTEATGRGQREWFSGDGYSFRRLAKIRDDDLLRLAWRIYSKRKYERIKADPTRFELLRAYKRAWMRQWVRRNPQRARAAWRRKHAAVRADPERRRRRTERAREAQRRRRSTPDGRRKSRAFALRYYHQRMADPAKRVALRAYQRARRAARKAEGAPQ